MEGWIKYYRTFRDHWLYKTKKPKTYREAWEDILLIVNYEPKKILVRGQLYDCERGQSLLSLASWADEFNWSIQMVRSFFILLENDKMITTEGLQYTTRLTVCNYDKYQGELTDDQQSNQQTDNKPLTDEQQAANKPLTTTKESKEDKELKKENKLEERAKIFYDKIAEFKNEYSKEMLRAFFNYWTEPNKSKTKMRFELEKTWDLSKRLNTWVSREKDFKKEYIPNIM